MYLSTSWPLLGTLNSKCEAKKVINAQPARMLRDQLHGYVDHVPTSDTLNPGLVPPSAFGPGSFVDSADTPSWIRAPIFRHIDL